VGLPTRTLMWLAGLLLTATLGAVLPEAALAATADFEAYPAETTITNQYADLGGTGQGVVFGPLPGAGGDGFRPVVKPAAVGEAASGTHVADISVCNNGPCSGFEFYPPVTTATFVSPKKQVSVRVGLDGAPKSCPGFDAPDCAEVTLQAYDANGDPVGSPSSAMVASGAGFKTPLSVTTPTAVIRGFKVSARADFDNNEPVRIDDVTFDTLSPPSRDFTLTPASTFLVMSQGSSISDTITIGRTGGSTGGIQFALLGSLPSGVSASFQPNPAGGSSTNLVITAAPDSAITGFNPIQLTVRGSPTSGNAGSSPRSFPISLQVRSPFDVAVDGSSDVDLAPCVVRVPVVVTRDGSFPGPVSLAVDGLANGVKASFDPAQATFPNGSRSERIDLVVTGPPTGKAVPRTTLTIRASAPGSGERTATVTVSGICPEEYDARVTSLEITQGVQTQSLPQRDPAFPRSPISYDEVPGAVRLRRDGTAVVRVYANLTYGPSGGAPSVPMLLYGNYYDSFGQRKAYPESPLTPISGLRTLKTGPPNPSAAEVASETNVYSFALPPSWTKRELSLTASVEPALSSTVRPCDSNTCIDDNRMTLSHIPFFPARGFTINPLDMRNAGTPNPDPSQVFKWARMVSPLAMTVKPYAATIDITDTSNAFKQCLSGATTDDEKDDCSDDANGAVADRVGDWTCDHGSGDRTWNVGVNTGVARGLKQTHFCVLELSLEDDAVVEYKRPLTSVSHEIGHLLGRPHADLLCGGNDDDQEGEAWPPDDRGYLQSNGLATDNGTGFNGGPFGVIAPPKQWIDYMSYCAVDTFPNPLTAGQCADLTCGPAWISARNWNRILGDFEYKRSAARNTAGAAQAPTVPSLHVSASAFGDSASIERVAPVDAPTQPPSASPYRLVGFNAAGQQIANIAMFQGSFHADDTGNGLALDGVIPAAGVVRVAIVRAGAILSSRTRSANAPTVSVRKPKFKRARATLRWSAADADGDALLATVDYSSNGGRSFEQIWTGPNGGSVRVPARYLSRSSKARLRVTVNDGFQQTSATSKRFRSPGAPPFVRILDPAKRVRQPNDAPLALTGEAFDDRLKQLRGKRLRWFLGKRKLGTGTRISRMGLRPGRHRIRLVARDKYGRVGHDSVKVKLTPARPIFITLKAPKRLKRRKHALRMRVASSLDARLVVKGKRLRRQHFAVSRKERKVRVRVPRGRKTLQLRLKLKTGKRASVRKLSVRRR
jgi:hypothetical protein